MCLSPPRPALCNHCRPLDESLLASNNTTCCTMNCQTSLSKMASLAPEVNDRTSASQEDNDTAFCVRLYERTTKLFKRITIDVVDLRYKPPAPSLSQYTSITCVFSSTSKFWCIVQLAGHPCTNGSVRQSKCKIPCAVEIQNQLYQTSFSLLCWCSHG